MSRSLTLRWRDHGYSRRHSLVIDSVRMVYVWSASFGLNGGLPIGILPSSSQGGGSCGLSSGDSLEPTSMLASTFARLKCGHLILALLFRVTLLRIN